MSDLIACGQNKLHDPILMKWALRRFQHAAMRGSERCGDMERMWFHGLSLRHWIDSDDRDVLADLFDKLPARLFVNLKPAVLSRWNEWGGSVAAGATKVLAECPAEQVLPMFANHFGANFLDLEKTRAVIACLANTPGEGARELLDQATARVADLPDGDVAKTILSQKLLRTVALRNASGFVSLVGICADAARLETGRTAQMLREIAVALFGSDALMVTAKDAVTGEDRSHFPALRALFRPDAPLDESDSIVDEPDFWPAAKSLLERYRGASATADAAGAVCALFEKHDGTDPADLASFAIAAVLSAFERDDVGAEALSMEQALDILSLNVAACRHSEQLAQRLRDFEPEMVARSIGARLQTHADEWGSVHLAVMAGQLRLTGAVPALIDSLAGEKGDFLCEAAADALARIGGPAELAVIERWDDLDESQRIYARGALEKIGGEASCRFALDRFAHHFHKDNEGWCSLMEACPDPRAIALLEPQLRRKQHVIDQCFYRLCILTDHQHADIGEIRARIEERRRNLLDHQAKFEAGHFGELFDTVPLTLRCEKCGDVNRYDIESVVVGKSGSGSACFVRDNVQCASCGQWADFEVTAEARMQMMAVMLVRSARPIPERGGHGNHGPLQVIDVTYRWQTRPAPEVMAELRSAAVEHPQSIVNHLRLGRMQYLFGRRGRAEESYRSALLIEPNSMEAGLGVAQTLADAGRRREAFDRLCQMLERKNDWRFFRTDELTPKTLGEDFIDLYNDLHEKLGARYRPLLQSTGAQSHSKVGRNDPCPCGSGTKYKKCCGNSQAESRH